MNLCSYEKQVLIAGIIMWVLSDIYILFIMQKASLFLFVDLIIT